MRSFLFIETRIKVLLINYNFLVFSGFTLSNFLDNRHIKDLTTQYKYALFF
jgi:hypothetical protein